MLAPPCARASLLSSRPQQGSLLCSVPVRPRLRATHACMAAASSTDTLVLAADIGGTNARYQLWRVALGGARTLAFEKTYQTAAHATFESSLDALLRESGTGAPTAACFAVAGPVTDNRCALTNVAWTIDAHPLRAQWGTQAVRVINDFEAVGYGILDLPPSELLTLHDAPVVARAPIVVLGPGTGLGQALLTWDEQAGGYTVWPSEGAHADFAPVGELQRRLAAWTESQLGECEVEQVCCGDGMVRIYDFLRTQPGAGAAPGGLTPAQVTEKALRGECAVAKEAVNMFLSILGAECANLGLKALARGGVYIAGGIPGKLLPAITSGGGHLQSAFLKPHCRFAKVRATLPLHLVRHPDPGLRGALAVALRECGGRK